MEESHGSTIPSCIHKVYCLEGGVARGRGVSSMMGGHSVLRSLWGPVASRSRFDSGDSTPVKQPQNYDRQRVAVIPEISKHVGERVS
jgi:hypothetical protein